MFLTKDELIELTGYKRGKDNARWLEREGFRFAVGIDGWPRVLRDVIIARYGDIAIARKEPRINFG